jgi:hypothetical protein
MHVHFAIIRFGKHSTICVHEKKPVPPRPREKLWFFIPAWQDLGMIDQVAIKRTRGAFAFSDDEE